MLADAAFSVSSDGEKSVSWFFGFVGILWFGLLRFF